MNESERISKLEKSLSDLQLRLSRLESFLSKSVPPEGGPSTSTSASLCKKERGGFTSKADSSLVTKVTSSAQSPQGGFWLGAVGILFFVLAASFFIKLIVDNGWLTPNRQLYGAILFGFALIGAGLKLKSRDVRYSTLLPAAGVIVEYLAVYGGHLYWQLYPYEVAIALIVAVSFFSLYLFSQLKHEAFIIASVIGSYTVPLLLERLGRDPFQAGIYFLFWDLSFCYMAIVGGNRLMIGLISYLALGLWYRLFGNGYYGNNLNSSLEEAALFQGLQFLILVSATALYSVKRRVELTSAEAWFLFFPLMIFYFSEYGFLTQIMPTLAPYLSLAFGLLILVIYVATKIKLGKESLASEPVVATFFTICFLHTVYFELLPDSWAPWFGLALAIVLGFLPKSRFNYDRFWPVYFLLGGLVGLEYARTIMDSDTALAINWLFSLILLFGYFYRDAARKGGFILWLGIVQVMVATSRIAKDVMSVPNSHYLTSALWALFGTALLIVAHKRRDLTMSRGAFGVLAIVSLKVLLSDINAANSMARIIALIVIGALMYGAGWIGRTIRRP